MRARPLAVFALCALLGTAATAGAQTAAPGSVISGGRDGPQGLVVAPWLEPAPLRPEVPLQSVLPPVLDDLLGLAENPVNRAIPAVETARPAPAASPKEAPRPTRRVRGQKGEAPRPIIMQQQNQ